MPPPATTSDELNECGNEAKNEEANFKQAKTQRLILIFNSIQFKSRKLLSETIRT